MAQPLRTAGCATAGRSSRTSLQLRGDPGTPDGAQPQKPATRWMVQKAATLPMA